MSIATQITRIAKNVSDSLDAVELNMALEEAFAISIPDEDLATFKTVQDIVTYIENNK